MENSKSIYEEFFLKDKKIIIPDYQREYSWTKDDIKIFLEDIKKSIEENDNEDMYLGTIYTYEPEKLNEVHIIDGQQRLTTTLLFLYVISNDILKDGKTEEFMSLSSGYEKRIKSDNKQLENAYAYSFYDVDELNDDFANDQIEENKKLIRTLLEEDFEFVDKVNKFLKKRLKVSIVTVVRLKDSLKIFMNLNARGKELQAMEIIKSMLFSYILELDVDESKKKYLKSSFSNIIYETESTKYNKNISNFKKILFLFISNLDIDKVEKEKLKYSEKDKLFASKFMSNLETKYDLNQFNDMEKFIKNFREFTRTYIWWHDKKISSYYNNNIEEEFRSKYIEINKGKCNDYATLISYNDFNFKNLREDFYKEILYAFSVIEFNKLFNNFSSDGASNNKVDLSFIERDNNKIIHCIKDNDIEGFKEIFNKKDYLITIEKYNKFTNDINNLLKVEEIKEEKLIKIVIKNIQDGNRIIKC